MNTLPYNTLKLLGWITVTLVVLSATFYLLLYINKRIQRNKSNNKLILGLRKFLKRALPFIHSYHPVFGTAAFITGIIHGFSLLQTVEVHSGYVLWFFILFMGLSGMSMKAIKSRSKYTFIRKLHRIVMFITIALMIFHVLNMKYFIFT